MNTLEYILKKYDLPTTGSPIEIPNVGRLDFIRWVRELGFKKGVEIGVDHGDFSKLIMDANYQLKMWGVDPYLHYWDEYHEYDSQEQMDHIFQRAKEKLTNEVKSGRYEFIRKKSQDALADFADESLDFVYIDGNHEGDFPYNDLAGWMRKVKKGGIVAGHDYVRIKTIDFTIKDALEKYTKENKIDPWFILGSYAVRSREIRDHSRSWAIVKE
jgi:hypothetical protein